MPSVVCVSQSCVGNLLGGDCEGTDQCRKEKMSWSGATAELGHGSLSFSHNSTTSAICHSLILKCTFLLL